MGTRPDESVVAAIGIEPGGSYEALPGHIVDGKNEWAQSHTQACRCRFDV